MSSRSTVPGTLTAASAASYTQINTLPGGLMCYMIIDGPSGTFTSTATITGWDTGNITTLANRYYRVYFELTIQSSDLDPVRLHLTDGSYSELAWCDVNPHTDGNEQVGYSFIHAPGAGTRRYLLRGQRLSGSGTCKASCDISGGLPGYFTVEDCGPSTGWS